MVIFYTMAYNASQTLPRTIQSVLEQAETDWIWYLLDNGSQDTTWKIIREYAQKDSRIIPLRNERNMEYTPDTDFTNLRMKHKNSDWLSYLDADDTYSVDFLSEMLAFVREYKLDVAACGSDFVDAATESTCGQRILQHDLIIAFPESFGIYFPIYHQFMRTSWAKLFSIRIIKQLDVARCPALYYGSDTLYTQEALRHAARFGILAKSLHQYYVCPKSRSYQWDPSRFEADHILHKLACAFLTDKCGNVSDRNRNFLQLVYCNAVADTLSVLRNSSLSPADKLREYRTIASHPLTRSVYQKCTDETAVKSRLLLLNSAVQAVEQIGYKDDTDFRAVFQSLFPVCGRALTGQNFSLFLKNQSLLQPLLQDDATLLIERLLTLIEKKQYGKKYNLLSAVQALAIDDPLLCQIGDVVFLRKYSKLYLMVWRKEYLSALDEMTGMLLEGQVRKAQEPFLCLYISLSAILKQDSAFIFGKLQIAQFYLSQNRKKECYIIIKELREMGVDNKELEGIQQALKETRE